MDMNLGGAFIWSVEMDDFSGHCGHGKYPLLRAIVNVIRPGTASAPAQQPYSPAREVPVSNNRLAKRKATNVSSAKQQKKTLGKYQTLSSWLLA